MNERAAEIARVDWFARLGAPLTDGEVDMAAGYARALDWPERVHVVGTFAECVAVLQRPADASSLWAREEALRAALHKDDASWADELTQILDPATARTNDAAARAFARLGVDDPYARYVAGGAALHAIHLYLLAQLARSPGADHPFVQRFALFTAGRWLLGGDARGVYLY